MVLLRSCTTNMYDNFSLVVTLFTFSHNPSLSRDTVLTKRNTLCQDFNSLVTRDGGSGRTLACFLPYGFSTQNVSTCWYPHNGQPRVECGRAVIAG